MSEPPFVYVNYIATTAQQLWVALTNDEFTRQYWGGKRLQSTWQLGASVTLLNDKNGIDFIGEILHYEPTSKLAYSFHVQLDEQSRSETPSRVTFELQPQGSLVKLSVTHEGFKLGSEVFQGISDGWPLFLSSLKTLLETGNALSLENFDCR